MKKIVYVKKAVCLSVALLLVCLFCLACAKEIPYNAILNSRANDLISDNFLKENRVKAFYPNDDYVEGENDRYIRDKDSPDTRTFIITEQQEFNEIFTKCTTPVDFESQIVILYIFGDVNPYRNYYLKNIELKENVLEVHYKLEEKNVDDSTMPYQRCFMLLMDKASFTDVQFVYLRR